MLRTALNRRVAIRRTVIVTALAVAATVGLAAPPAQAALVPGLESDNVFLGTAAQQAKAFSEAGTLGVKVVRADLLWSSVAANCGSTPRAQLSTSTTACYNWATVDQAVTDARLNHVGVMLSVSGVPSWVLHNAPYTVGNTQAQYKTMLAQYLLFLHAAATRYGTTSPYGFVRYWTIWNEPNSRTFWFPFTSASPQDYALMVADGAKVIRQASPKAQVAAGPTGPNSTGSKPVKYIESVQPWLVRYKARKWLSAWAHNPYPMPGVGPHQKAYVSPSIGIGNFRDLLTTLDRSSATRHLPVWATEFSYQTKPQDPTGVSYADQATYMGEMFDILSATGRVPIAVWYVLQDPPAAADWQSGMFDVHGRRKPSFAMFQRMVSVGAVSTHRGGRVHLFGMDNVTPAQGKLVWSTNGHSRWKLVPHQHNSHGIITASPAFSRTMYVAVKDAKGVGPARSVRV